MDILTQESRGSILLVDDTPANLQLLISALGAQNYDVRPAINGELALESAQALCPDLVLLDINMPGLDGYEVCRRLKADPRTSAVPVIFISSMEETLDKVKAFEAGGVDYISKPFQSEEVLARIHSHLVLRQTQQRLEQEIVRRQQVQDELSEHKRHLESLVARRTQELAERNRELLDEVNHRRGVEQALQESEHRYLALVEEGFDGLFIHQDGKIIYLNQQMADMVGCEPSVLLGYEALKLVTADSEQEIERRIFERKTGPFEVDMLRWDGSVLRVEAFSVLCKFHGKDAQIVRTRDITARVRAEEELRASEREYANLSHQFETLLDAISDPLVLLTPGMKALWTNAAYDQACNELNCTTESGMTLFDLDVGHKESPILRCFKQGVVVEEVVTTPDKRMWGVKAFPLKSSVRTVNQAIVIAVDITEKVRLREEASRSSRLASLGELAAGVAHEINNPNAVILLNAPIIKDAFTDAEKILIDYYRREGELTLAGIDYVDMQIELPALIDRVLESAERIKRIVEDLKNFVRDEGPREFDQVDLNGVVEAGARLLQSAIKKATSNFSLQLTAGLPSVKGDFQKLEQVVVNLIQNACQALTETTQAISVETDFDPQQQMLILRVRDQGQGIAAEQLDRLTDPFFTTKRTSGGTGLGLSVSERILREHRAQLQIESQPDQGAVFSVFIPVWEVE